MDLRYFFHIGYLGTKFFGWQWQPKQVTIQQIIEDCLQQILKRKITIFGCGRTDAGVHALQYFFHTDLPEVPEFDLKQRMNHILPEDIAIFDMIQIQADAHARYDANSRTYDYFFHTYKDPLLSTTSTFFDVKDLDLYEMGKAVRLLPRYRDYKNLCKSPEKNDHTICEVRSAILYSNSKQNRFRFSITANRFLARMIRILTKKIIDIGQGKLTSQDLEAILKNDAGGLGIIPAAPQGLFLTRVTYPYLHLEPASDFLGIGIDERGYWKEINGNVGVSAELSVKNIKPAINEMGL